MFTMKRIYLLLWVLCIATLGGFAQGKNAAYTSFGKTIQADGSITANKAYGQYAGMGTKDTLATKFSAEVTGVCQVKGCWMTLALTDGTETMVRFKDYGFFMPRDIVGKQVVVNGKAFVEEMSVEDQRHYAKDAGQSDAEVALIVEPKRVYGFEADGVLLKN